MADEFSNAAPALRMAAALPLMLLAAVNRVQPCAAFKHGWDTVQDQMWGWIGNDHLPGMLEWYAQNYGVVVVGSGPADAGHAPGGGPCKPPGACIHNGSFPGAFVLAKQLKALNPKIKTLLYEASGFVSDCTHRYSCNLLPLPAALPDLATPFVALLCRARSASALPR